MATITIRNLDETVKRKLQVRAALNGRSMEAEARELLAQLAANESPLPRQGLGTAIHKQFAALGGVELEIPPRQFSSREGNETKKENTGTQLKEGLGTAIHKLFAPLGGVELEIPPRRKSHRPIPTFE
jgi:plasmid stability protein